MLRSDDALVVGKRDHRDREPVHVGMFDYVRCCYPSSATMVKPAALLAVFTRLVRTAGAISVSCRFVPGVCLLRVVQVEELDSCIYVIGGSSAAV